MILGMNGDYANVQAGFNVLAFVMEYECVFHIVGNVCFSIIQINFGLRILVPFSSYFDKVLCSLQELLDVLWQSALQLLADSFDQVADGTHYGQQTWCWTWKRALTQEIRNLRYDARIHNSVQLYLGSVALGQNIYWAWESETLFSCHRPLYVVSTKYQSPNFVKRKLLQ
jgi:hypothetical protein